VTRGGGAASRGIPGHGRLHRTGGDRPRGREPGIFSRVVPDERVRAEAERVATQICRTGPQARLHIRRIVDYDRTTFDVLLFNEEMARAAGRSPEGASRRGRRRSPHGRQVLSRPDPNTAPALLSARRCSRRLRSAIDAMRSHPPAV
jgi:hypothetical protein